MTYRPNSLLVGLVTACAVIAGCGTNPTETMTLSTATTTPATSIATTSSVASSPPTSIDQPGATTTTTPTTTTTSIATTSSVVSAQPTSTDRPDTDTNDAGTDTDDSDPGTDNKPVNKPASQTTSVAASEAVAADLAGIDQLGMCDGSWVSVLDDTNSTMPPGLDELVESWRCQFGDFDIEVLRWADADETRDNLLAIKRVTSEAGADPALWRFVLKGDHIVGTSTFELGSDKELEMLAQIQAKIGGEVIILSEYT